MIDDLDLLSKIKNRDQDAIRTLHQRYVNLVYSIAYRVLDDPTAAEEATQDTFFKIWQNATSFNAERGPVIAWLSSIARNAALDRRRSEAHHKDLIDFDADFGDNERFSLIPDDWGDRERAEALRQALMALPQEQSQLLQLGYFGGFSQSEIAAQLKIPLGTVKTRMRIGLQQLRKAWFKS